MSEQRYEQGMGRPQVDIGRRVVILDVRSFIPEARFVIGDDAEGIPVELASIGDQARVLDVFRNHRPDEVVHAGMIIDPAYRGELSVENARTQLGWEPRYRSIRDGIAQYVEQYRAYHEAAG